MCLNVQAPLVNREESRDGTAILGRPCAWASVCAWASACACLCVAICLYSKVAKLWVVIVGTKYCISIVRLL